MLKCRSFQCQDVNKHRAWFGQLGEFAVEQMLGLDVDAARSIRKIVREWLAERKGRTLLLTTRYMMEADELCDRLAIIDKGKVLACDTPANLKRRVQKHQLFEITVTPSANGPMRLDAIPGVHQATETPGPTAIDLKLSLQEDSIIGAVVQRIVESGSRILSLKKTEPTLEDVFIELVGHGLG